MRTQGQGAGAELDFTALLAAGFKWSEFFEQLIANAAIIAGLRASQLRELPLDACIDALRTIAVAVIVRNTEYIAGPVVRSIERLSEVGRVAIGAGDPMGSSATCTRAGMP
ncbi:MAG: hypothetical protein K8F35_09715 [Dokdonella sp.]|uniref:hypothetical protein n=1 Tax=Dokdonella sp. TaxID=2291710 RepID=UPI0025C67042|nr:hypothetical protein [Dokdonella sp.]MBZ0223295.1 hypothetical protein [Dokdonella sp.]